MQRINRSPRAPVGTAFFLFVGLAIIPVSLRATGIQINFAPRLTAANDAWQQIAEVFGASYRPAIAPDLSVVKREARPSDPSETSEPEPNSDRLTACSKEPQEPQLSQPVPQEKASLRVIPVRKAKTSSPRSVSENQAVILAAPVTIKASFEEIKPITSALGSLRVASLKRKDLLKRIDHRLFQTSFKPFVELRNLPGSKDVHVVVRAKRAVAGSFPKPAERKVFSAMASARRRECDRAMLLTRFPSDSSEFGEF